MELLSKLETRMLKQFRDLAAGDRALATFNKPIWVVISDPPIPLDESSLDGLWRVDTKEGKWLEWALTEVTVK